MNIVKSTFAIICILIVSGLTFGFEAASISDGPDLPPGCGNIAVPAGNRLARRVYAVGVQVYWWNGSTWGFVVPLAELYSDPAGNGKVGIHYGGPTWKSNSGSLVIGERLASCTPDPNSISWLLLAADETDGNGIFADVTYIQRINTSGGKAPSVPGAYFGEEVRIPYTTEYYFYKRAEQ